MPKRERQHELQIHSRVHLSERTRVSIQNLINYELLLKGESKANILLELAANKNKMRTASLFTAHKFHFPAECCFRKRVSMTPSFLTQPKKTIL